MAEFWNSDVTNASWERLLLLNKEIKFMLIGGWAVYLYTKLQKSKDIDIVVDYETLRYLGKNYALNKNDRLRKYEIKLDKFDIDVYLPRYSKLSIQPSDLLSRFSDSMEGICVPRSDALMTLKLGALNARADSLKGWKDKVDVIGLLFYSGVDVMQLRSTLVECGHQEWMKYLLDTLEHFDKRLIKYLNTNEKEFADKRSEISAAIKKTL